MNKNNKTVAVGLIILGVIISVAALSSCGTDGTNGRDALAAPWGEDGSPGTNGSNGTDGTNYTPVFDTFTFPSNTTCQVVYTGFSAKKPSASSSTLRLYGNATCAGTILSTLKASGNEFYQSGSVQFVLEGTNATGLKLHVFAF